MYIAAVRELRVRPKDAALLPTGELLILSWSGQGLHLAAYDTDLALLWGRPLGENALGLNVDRQGTPWVLDRSGASAYTPEGDVAGRTEPPALKAMHVAALTFVDDELVFCYQHAPGTPLHPPVLARITPGGAVRWTTTLTTPSIDLERYAREPRPISLADYRPRSWVTGYHGAGELTVSGDTLFAVYGDIPASGLSLGYAASLTDGALRYTTGGGPIHSVAAHPGGAFLVGYQGYDAFETVLYDRAGNRKTRWNSHGHYVVETDGVRVIELENRLPSRSRLVRLNSDGTVTRGDLLEGYYTSEPYLHRDGTLFFAREGMMIAARGLMIDERVVIRHRSDSDSYVIHSRVLGGDEGMFVTYTEGTEGTSDVSGLLRVMA